MLVLSIAFSIYFLGSLVMHGFLHDLLRAEIGPMLKNESEEEYNTDVMSFYTAIHIMAVLWPATIFTTAMFAVYSTLKSFISAK